MSTNPVDLLFNAYRRQVLGLLLLRPEDSLHVREISRLAGVPAGSLHRELRALTEAGLLLREPVGNQVRYRANRGCPIFKELAGIFRKSSLEGASMITSDQGGPVAGGTIVAPREELERLARRYHIRRLALFGSAARGELGPDSDIDLLVEFEPGQAPSLWAEQDLEGSFSQLFGGRRVDIAPPGIMRNPYRRKHIERDMKVLYEAA